MEHQKGSDIKVLILLIKNFFLYCLRKWVLIGIIIFSAGLFSAIMVWMQKPKYKAELTFALEESSGSSSGYANLASQLGFNIGGSSSSGIFKGDNLLELFKSRFIMEGTLLSEAVIDGKKQLLINAYLELTGKGEALVKNKLLPSEYFLISAGKSFSPSQDSILYAIQKEISEKLLEVSRIDKKLSIISVSITFRNQSFAIAFCENLVDKVTQFYVQTTTKKEAHNVEVLESQADSLRNLMSLAITSVASANDLNVNPAKQILRVSSQKSQIDANVFGVAYGEILKNLELAKITLRRETPLIQIIDRPRYPLENLKGGRLNAFIGGGFIAFIILLPILVITYYMKRTTEI